MSAPALAGSWACQAELERVLDGLVALDCRAWSPLNHYCLASHSDWFLVAVVPFLERTASQFGCARISGGPLRSIGMRFHEQLNFSVERMAAGAAGLQIRASGARRHRSPHRWAKAVV